MNLSLLKRGQFIAGKSTEILIRKSALDLKIALGIFNSKLISLYINQAYSVLGIDGGVNFTPDLIENLPFQNFDVEEQMPLTHLVEQVLTIKKQNVGADTKDLESKIDQMVYQLYGLTDEEIKIIEEEEKE